MKRPLPLLLAGLLLGLVQIALAPHAVARDRYAAIHSVGVISAIGDRLAITSTGMMAVGRDKKDMPIDDWGIDRWMVTTLSQALAARFEVKPVNVDRAAFFDCAAKCAGLLKRDSGVDAFVLVRKVEESAFKDATSGISLHFTRAMLGKYTLTTDSDFVIEVIDAKTGKVLDYGSPDQPVVIFTANDWPNSWEELTQAQRETLKSTITDNIEKELPVALNSASLPPLKANRQRILAPTNDAQTAGALAKIHSVAVVSALGDQIHLVTPGNPWTNQTKEQVAPPTAWTLDTEIEAVARPILARHFKVETVTLDRSALAKLSMDNGNSAPPPPLSLPASDAVDAYIVIAKANYREGMFEGVGLWHWTPLLDETTGVYVNYDILVVDAKTSAVLAHYPVKAGEKHPCDTPRRFGSGLPECEVSGKFWPKTPGALTPQAQDVIHQRLTEIFAVTLPETLSQLGWD